MSQSPDAEKKIYKVSPDKLCLDLDNPRLLPEQYTGVPLNDEVSIIQALAQYDLEELLQSIAENGYLNIEPLYVSKLENNRYKVLEGNRRLAAIKLLRDSALAKKCGLTPPTIAPDKLATLEKILVLEAIDDKDGLAYIGFKHINGPHKWDSIAKARFVLQLYKKDYAVTQISKMIGDTHNTIQKMLIGMTVLEQATDEDLFTLEDRHKSLRVFPFSHLYTALTRKEYQNFLGLKKEISFAPVPRENLPRLGQLLCWIYGSKKDDIKPIIKSQNPDIKNLGTVISNSRALMILESKGDLDEALKQTVPPTKALKDSLVSALFSAKDALGYSSDIIDTDDDTRDLAIKLKKTTDSIYQLLTTKEKSLPDTDMRKLLIQLKDNPALLDYILNK